MDNPNFLHILIVMKNHYHKEPLYRKVNTLARNHHHPLGGDFRHIRNTKKHQDMENEGQVRYSMHGKKKRGLDYTPLFKFLLSKVGQPWNSVYQEAISRLDKKEPIFWMVSINEDDKENIKNLGENSYYSGLYVDENGILQKVDPQSNYTQVLVRCTCCTYSFNGVAIKSFPKEA